MVTGDRGVLGVRAEEEPRPGIAFVTIHLLLMVARNALEAATKSSLAIIIHVVRQDASTLVFQEGVQPAAGVLLAISPHHMIQGNVFVSKISENSSCIF